VTESSAIRSAIAKYEGQARALIPILQEIQDELRWLSPQTLEAVAAGLGLSLAHVYSVATFYKSFSLEPRGRRTCTVCMGTACHVRGAKLILDSISRELHLEPGHTSDDRKFTLETVNCLGSCALGPLVVVDEEYIGHSTSMKMKKITDKLKKED
jgi:NADH-quinone oxidoreductase subunit E